MKKNERVQVLKLNRETLCNLEEGKLRAAAGVEEARSVKFCTEGCTTTGGIT